MEAFPLSQLVFYDISVGQQHVFLYIYHTVQFPLVSGIVYVDILLLIWVPFS